MKLRCAECQCAPQECIKQQAFRCQNCTKEICCCVSFHRRSERCASSFIQYFGHVVALYAAALGIEILCITAAEIGENSGLYLFGFNPLGMTIAYTMGYILAGFTPFITILGSTILAHQNTVCVAAVLC